MIPMDLKRRVYKLEIFDEMEEWNLLLSHYCLTVATRGSLLAAVHTDMKCRQSINPIASMLIPPPPAPATDVDR